MLHLVKAAIRNPRIPFEAASWLFQKHVLRRDPVLNHYGVIIGQFVDFSEFHSFPSSVNQAEYRFLRDLDLGEGAIVDIGANLGIISLLLDQLHPGRRIIAFEPGPSTFQALEANVARNNADIQLQRCALADFDGEIVFSMQEKARANSMIAQDGKGTAVPARQMDTMLAELGIEEIAFLKIDTEGHETTVLRGAEKVLREIKPQIIYFEICPELTRRAGFDVDGPAQIIADAGYDLFELNEQGGLEPVKPADASSRHLANWVAIRKSPK